MDFVSVALKKRYISFAAQCKNLKLSSGGWDIIYTVIRLNKKSKIFSCKWPEIIVTHFKCYYSQTCLSGHLPIVTTKIDSHGGTLSV